MTISERTKESISRWSAGYCVAISHRSGYCELTMQLSCLIDQPNMAVVTQGNTPEVVGRCSRIRLIQARHLATTCCRVIDQT